MNIFDQIPLTRRGHFLLHFYAAIYRLLFYLNHLEETDKDRRFLEDTFKQYPFLGGYFEEICSFMPQELTWESALKWWKEQITAWEEKISFHLPLRAVSKSNGITFESLTALMIVGLVEEDSRFGTLFNQMQAPLAMRRPCTELVGQVMRYNDEGKNSDSWLILNPLLASGFLEVLNSDAPRSEWALRIPPVLWNVIRNDIEEHPAPSLEYHSSETFLSFESLVFPSVFIEQLKQVPRLIEGGRAESIVLRSTPGSDRFQAAGALARAMGHNIIAVNGKHETIEKNLGIIGPLCILSRSIPLFYYETGPGETAEVFVSKEYKGPYIIFSGHEGGLHGKAVEKAVALNVPALSASDRKRCWAASLNTHPVENLDTISERYHIPGGYIRQAASLAAAHAGLEQRKTIGISDVRHACRSLNRQLLDTLAVRLEIEGAWDQVIVNPVTTEKLRELEKRCRYREKLFENLGPAFGSVRNTGVRALFSGASGTGKTLAATILAAELGMDLYRVDLAAVVNKYIGETEKNLHKVLTRAEELDVILLLDEGDALLGMRTEVKTANDRYANMETDYLLQKLENYQGIIIITTNAVENIDNAFQRRMDVVVSFVPPQAQERLLIWQLHLPVDHQVDDVSLKNAAIRCAMTGGQIRNAALNAALLALDENRKVSTVHFVEAIHSEFRKAGAICPLKR